MNVVRAMCTASAGPEPVLVTGADDGYPGIWRIDDSGFALSAKIPLGYPVTSLATGDDTVIVGPAAGLAAIRISGDD